MKPVQPEVADLAPEARKLPDEKPSLTPPVNPRTQSHVFTTRNPDALLNLTKKYALTKTSSYEPKLPETNDWFTHLNNFRTIEKAEPDQFTIDVVPDQRFTCCYIMNYCAKNIHSIDTQDNSFFSLYSQIAYEMILYNAYLLISELSSRPIKSSWGRDYLEDAARDQFFRTLCSCNISTDLAYLIRNMVAVTDAHRPTLTYVPCLAAAHYKYDFGRLILPSIFLVMHNYVVSTRSSTPPAEILRQFYATPLYQEDDIQIYIGNILGGYYLQGDATMEHKNWFNERIEAVFSPSVSRAHQRRPLLAPLRTGNPNITEDSNLYDLMLTYNINNLSSVMNFVQSMSRTYETCKTISCVPLHSVFESAAGSLMFSHSVSTYALPTWHRLPRPTTQLTAETRTTEVSDSDFATTTHFLVIPVHKVTQHQQPYPTDEKTINPKLYQVSKDAYDVTKGIPYQAFSPKHDVLPYRSIFQPYQRNATNSTLTETLGIQIELNELDATCIPLPNLDQSLFFNNSNYCSGSIPIVKTYVPVMDTRPENATVCMHRTLHRSQITGLAIRDGSKVIIPRFSNGALLSDPNLPSGMVYEPNHIVPTRAFTYTAWRDQGTIRIPDHSLLLWSSYRHVRTTNTGRQLSVYYTFRGFYGVSVPLFNTPHPAMTMIKS